MAWIANGNCVEWHGHGRPEVRPSEAWRCRPSGLLTPALARLPLVGRRPGAFGDDPQAAVAPCRPSAVKEARGSASRSGSAPVRAASLISFLVTPTATISPLPASMPMCGLRQYRRRDVPCFSTGHPPAPESFSRVLSTSKCSGPVPGCRHGGASSILVRWPNVEWPGTARSSPGSSIAEPTSPSV